MRQMVPLEIPCTLPDSSMSPLSATSEYGGGAADSVSSFPALESVVEPILTLKEEIDRIIQERKLKIITWMVFPISGKQKYGRSRLSSRTRIPSRIEASVILKKKQDWGRAYAVNPFRISIQTSHAGSRIPYSVLRT